jgi:hypothetical protein
MLIINNIFIFFINILYNIEQYFIMDNWNKSIWNILSDNAIYEVFLNKKILHYINKESSFNEYDTKWNYSNTGLYNNIMKNGVNIGHFSFHYNENINSVSHIKIENSQIINSQITKSQIKKSQITNSKINTLFQYYNGKISIKYENNTNYSCIMSIVMISTELGLNALINVGAYKRDFYKNNRKLILDEKYLIDNYYDNYYYYYDINIKREKDRRIEENRRIEEEKEEIVENEELRNWIKNKEEEEKKNRKRQKENIDSDSDYNYHKNKFIKRGGGDNDIIYQILDIPMDEYFLINLILSKYILQTKIINNIKSNFNKTKIDNYTISFKEIILNKEYIEILNMIKNSLENKKEYCEILKKNIVKELKDSQEFSNYFTFTSNTNDIENSFTKDDIENSFTKDDIENMKISSQYKPKIIFDKEFNISSQETNKTEEIIKNLKNKYIKYKNKYLSLKIVK